MARPPGTSNAICTLPLVGRSNELLIQIHFTAESTVVAVSVQNHTDWNRRRIGSEFDGIIRLKLYYFTINMQL